ncbi:MAG: sugar ABC transporter substrate-binding protein [Chloroflexi bacterium]|nr:sugar ABC transporter substrate-binding protein [Chloroflexota bacterium]
MRQLTQEGQVTTTTRRRIVTGGMGGLAGVVLAACGATATRGTGGTSTQAGQAGGSAAIKSKQPVTIEVLTRKGVSSPTGHSQFYKNVTEKRFTPETNITVNLIDAEPNVGEKLTIMAAGGTVPDASWFGVVADGVAGREQATKGIFKPLDPLAKKDPRFDLKPYFKAMLDAFSVAGKLYALPTHAHYGTNVLYYNKNMTRAAGIKVADDGKWTIDDLIEAAQKLTNKAEDVWGWWPSFGFSEFGTFWVREFGGEFLDAPGTKVLIDSPPAREAFEFVYGAQTKFQTIDDLYRSGGPGKLFEEGRLAFFAATPAQVALYRKPGQERIQHELGVALFPTHPKGMRGTQASGSGMGITGTQKVEASWEWVKFITSKETGIEGVLTGGAGSPGGRTDVWNDPRFLAFDPIYATIIKAYPQGAGSLRLPANYRYTELVKTVNEELKRYFKGEVSVTDATSKAVQAGNAILSQ